MAPGHQARAALGPGARDSLRGSERLAGMRVLQVGNRVCVLDAKPRVPLGLRQIGDNFQASKFIGVGCFFVFVF